MKVDYRVVETPDGRLVPEDQAFDGGVLYARAGDVLSEEDMARLEGYEVEGDEEVEEAEEADEPLTRSEVINLLGDHDWVHNLIGAGYASLSALEDASDEELEGVDGVGPARVEDIREALAGDEESD